MIYNQRPGKALTTEIHRVCMYVKYNNRHIRLSNYLFSFQQTIVGASHSTYIGQIDNGPCMNAEQAEVITCRFVCCVLLVFVLLCLLLDMFVWLVLPAHCVYCFHNHAADRTPPVHESPKKCKAHKHNLHL